MTPKHDPNKNLIAVLKKHKLDDLLSDVGSWLDSEPGSPGALKKHFIATFANVNYYDIDLKDPTTWGDIEDMPPDQFFIDMFKAIKADEKRNAKRSSYEF